MKIKVLIVYFIFFFLISPNMLSGSSLGVDNGKKTPLWCTFQGDNQRTGQSGYNPEMVERLKWKYNYKGVMRSSSSPIIDDTGTIYVCTCPSGIGRINAIGPEGKSKWYFETMEQIFSSPCLGPDGNIYVGSEDGYLYSLSSKGELLWKFHANGKVGSPLVSNNGTIYFCAKNDSDSDEPVLFYALDEDGNMIWSTGVRHYSHLPLALDSNGTIYYPCSGSWYRGKDIGFTEHLLYAISPTGKIKWTYLTKDYKSSSAMIGSGNTIYLGYSTLGSLSAASGKRGYLCAISVNGTLKWTYFLNGSSCSTPGISRDGIIYVGSNDRNFSAVNSNASLKWKLPTRLDYFTAPVIDSKGRIYFVNSGPCPDRGYASESDFTSIDPNGKIKWKYRVEEGKGASPVIASNERIFFSTGSALYLFGKTTSFHKMIDFLLSVPFVFYIALGVAILIIISTLLFIKYYVRRRKKRNLRSRKY